MWRLGTPAVLMIAFALIGLTTTWREADAPPPARLVAAVTAGPGHVAPPAALVAEARPADTDPGAERTEAVARDTADEPTPAVERLPEELGPVPPDVVVALEVPRADALRPPIALAHTHLTESAHDDVRGPVALAPQAGDDFQGPEPGALYWFGPRGLERIKVLGEARR